MHLKMSGPNHSRTQAIKALEDAGFVVHLDEFGEPLNHNWGMEHEVDNGAWLTVEGDDIDKANDAVGPFGWRLRAHHDAPERPERQDIAGVSERLKSLGLDPSALRTLLRDGER